MPSSKSASRSSATCERGFSVRRCVAAPARSSGPLTRSISRRYSSRACSASIWRRSLRKRLQAHFEFLGQRHRRRVLGLGGFMGAAQGGLKWPDVRRRGVPGSTPQLGWRRRPARFASVLKLAGKSHHEGVHLRRRCHRRLHRHAAGRRGRVQRWRAVARGPTLQALRQHGWRLRQGGQLLQAAGPGRRGPARTGGHGPGGGGGQGPGAGRGGAAHRAAARRRTRWCCRR